MNPERHTQLQPPIMLTQLGLGSQTAAPVSHSSISKQVPSPLPCPVKPGKTPQIHFMGGSQSTQYPPMLSQGGVSCALTDVNACCCSVGIQNAAVSFHALASVTTTRCLIDAMICIMVTGVRFRETGASGLGATKIQVGIRLGSNDSSIDECNHQQFLLRWSHRSFRSLLANTSIWFCFFRII